MVTIRTQSQIVSDMLDDLRISQPQLDTKPGTVARDLFVDNFANQQARLYGEISRVSTSQSIRQAIGADLDRFGDGNFAVPRDKGRKATGPAVLTFSSLNIDFSISKGDLVFSRNGASFRVVNATTVSSVNSNQYKAFASRIRADLDFVGITDQYAIQVLVECISIGLSGNISKYSLSSSNISGVNRVTNTVSFGGGVAGEGDASYRNRIFSVFSGANTGTASGYRNIALQDPSVQDAVVITPGDPLMTRDGTQISIAANGTKTVVSDGTGGKVDIIILGVRLQENVDSYIYQDKSNKNDPTDSSNDFTLGQIDGDENKTVTKKRLDNLSNSVLPNQPINNVISVSGTLSGNFKEKSVDSFGRVTGNYQLIRDTGAYAGSCWGFDRIGWIDSAIRSFSEEKTKLTFNGQDALGFTDALKISAAQQNISVVNENSQTIPSDRTLLQLAHKNVTSVTRVQNITTGERYSVTDQNPDGGSSNTTGRVRITGKNLPSVTDILQVDYSWLFQFDRFYDFDDIETSTSPRVTGDSIDWGYSNAVVREISSIVTNGSYFIATTSHPVGSIISVASVTNESATVTLINNRLAVVLSGVVSNVIGISNGTVEVWLTAAQDGSISSQTIFLPTDTIAKYGDVVTVTYNAIDRYGSTGSFSGTTVSIPSSVGLSSGQTVEITYLADVSILLPSMTLSSLPAVRKGNAFTTSSISSTGVQPTTHVFDSNNNIIKNLRKAPSNLGLTITGSISAGTITASGVTVKKVSESVFTIGTAGLQIDLAGSIKTDLGLNSNQSVPSNVKLSKIDKVEKVTTNSGLNVLSSDRTYDLKGYTLQDASYVRLDASSSSLLTASQMILPSTANNIANQLQVGDRVRVSFHYITTSDTESVSFSRPGTLYTDKRFATIDSISISSGFTSTSSSSATLTVSNLNQPSTRSRYSVLYDYSAPKANERITIDYNSDRLITDVTLTIEDKRPITADVLVKSATPIPIDVEMNIIVTSSLLSSASIVLQNVKDAITSSLNSNVLNTTVDSTDLIQTAYSVNGVDAVRIIKFNKTNQPGSVLSVTSQKNEYIVASSITIGQDTR